MCLNKNKTEETLPLTLLFAISTLMTLWTLLLEWFLYYFEINSPKHGFNVPPEWSTMVIEKCQVFDSDIADEVDYIFAKNSIP